MRTTAGVYRVHGSHHIKILCVQCIIAAGWIQRTVACAPSPRHPLASTTGRWPWPLSLCCVHLREHIKHAHSRRRAAATCTSLVVGEAQKLLLRRCGRPQSSTPAAQAGAITVCQYRVPGTVVMNGADCIGSATNPADMVNDGTSPRARGPSFAPRRAFAQWKLHLALDDFATATQRLWGTCVCRLHSVAAVRPCQRRKWLCRPHRAWTVESERGTKSFQCCFHRATELPRRRRLRDRVEQAQRSQRQQLQTLKLFALLHVAACAMLRTHRLLVQRQLSPLGGHRRPIPSEACRCASKRGGFLHHLSAQESYRRSLVSRE
jgi:hypothetical protein